MGIPGVSLKDFLEVIHVDIVKVWDLDDKHNVRIITAP